MLSLKNIDSGYNKRQIIYNISITVEKGDVIGVVGPNGSGKSTLLKVIAGLIPSWHGSIIFEGSVMNGLNPAESVRRGIMLSPQDVHVFKNMTVYENFKISALGISEKEMNRRIDYVLNLFPFIENRIHDNASLLSGGEQQMIALARVLIKKPLLIMLDEPTSGLSPNIIKTVFKNIQKINQDDSVTFLIVEHRVKEIINMCDRVIAMKMGRCVLDCYTDQLEINDIRLKKVFLE